MVKQRSRYMLAKNRCAGPKFLSRDATQKTAIAQDPVLTIITRRVNLKRSSRAKACVFTIFTRRVNRKLAQYARPNSQPDPHHAKPFAVGLFCVALITWQCSKCKPQTLPKKLPSIAMPKKHNSFDYCFRTRCSAMAASAR